MWQHFCSLWGYIHTHTYTYRYFMRSWAIPRTQKAEKQQWLPTLSLLSDSQSPLDPQMSLWPLFSPHYSYDFMTMPENQHHKQPPENKWNQRVSLQMQKQPNVRSLTHQQKKKAIFLPFVGTVEMLHILKMLEAITTVIPSGKRQVSAAAGALTSQHQQKGEGEGREEQPSGTQFSHSPSLTDPVWILLQWGPGMKHSSEDFRGGKTRNMLKTLTSLHRNATQSALTPSSYSPLAFPWEE